MSTYQVTGMFVGDSEVHLSKLIELSERQRVNPSLNGIVERELVPYFANEAQLQPTMPTSRSYNPTHDRRISDPGHLPQSRVHRKKPTKQRDSSRRESVSTRPASFEGFVIAGPPQPSSTLLAGCRTGSAPTLSTPPSRSSESEDDGYYSL